MIILVMGPEGHVRQVETYSWARGSRCASPSKCAPPSGRRRTKTEILEAAASLRERGFDDEAYELLERYILKCCR